MERGFTPSARCGSMELPALFLGSCAGAPSHSSGSIAMHFGFAHLQPIVSLIAGVLILLIPRLLNYIVAIYLIVIGLIGLGLIR
jgi:hypothetical protein